MAIVRTQRNGQTHMNGVDLRKLGRYSRITALLAELGFSFHKSTVGVALDTKALSIFLKDLNKTYEISETPVEDDVTIFSLYEPWLLEFLQKAIRARHLPKKYQMFKVVSV